MQIRIRICIRVKAGSGSSHDLHQMSCTVEAQNGSMEGVDTDWRREGSKWSRGWPVDQWFYITITLVNSRIRLGSASRWKVGSGCASASKWKVVSGSASKWKEGSGSASKWWGSATLLRVYNDAVAMWCSRQMKGRWESNINVWFPFMYSQQWNYYFQNRIIIFCLPVLLLIYLWKVYIFPGAMGKTLV